MDNNAPAEAGRKRKRVTISEAAPQDAGASASSRRRVAPDSGSSARTAATLEFDDDEGAHSSTVVGAASYAGAGKASAVDEDDDDDDVVEDGGDDDDDDGDDDDDDKSDEARGPNSASDSAAAARAVPRPSRRLLRVAGERRSAGAGEEFNEAGDAFEPFHLKQERAEGYFDNGGNYVWNKKADVEQDAWLDGLDAMDPRERARMQAAAALARGRGGSDGGAAGPADATNDDDEEDDDDDDDDEPAEETRADLAPSARAEILVALHGMLQEGESVAAALRRLSGMAPSGGSARASSAPPPRDMATFNRLTEAADALVGAGAAAVYSWRRKDVVWQLEDACDAAGLNAAALLRAAQPPPPPPPPADGRLWEYKVDASADAAVHGPFPTGYLAAWKAAGMFGESRPIYVRLAGTDAPFVVHSAAGL